MAEVGRKFELNQLEAQTKATQEAAEKLASLDTRIESLERTIDSSANSSGRVAVALNWLTGALVIVGAASVWVQYASNS